MACGRIGEAGVRRPRVEIRASLSPAIAGRHPPELDGRGVFFEEDPSGFPIEKGYRYTNVAAVEHHLQYPLLRRARKPAEGARRLIPVGLAREHRGRVSPSAPLPHGPTA